MAKYTEANLLPYRVILAASGGDVDALNAVLKHYAGYIDTLATRCLYDENGELPVSYTHLAGCSCRPASDGTDRSGCASGPAVDDPSPVVSAGGLDAGAR